MENQTRKLLSYLVLFSCFIIGTPSVFAQPQVGDVCDDYNELYTQEILGETATTVNGQLFVAQADYDDVLGIYLNLEALPAGSYTLDLYAGSVLPDFRDGLGTPIASSTINPASDIPTNQQAEVLFEFDTPVSLTNGESYYFILESSINSTIIWATGLDPIEGGIFRMFSQAESTVTTFFIPSRDIGFGLYDCNAPTPVCSISNLSKVIDDECNGEGSSYALSWDVSGGSGTYSIVAAADNAELGITMGEELAEFSSGQTDMIGLGFAGLLAGVTSPQTISINVIDKINTGCASASPLTINLAACAPLPPPVADELPAFPKFLLFGFALMVIAGSIFMMRKF